MNQEFKMNVNPLPAKTWNWFHMNGTALREATITQTGTVTVKKPESVTCTEGRDENIQAAETGMGKDMDAFAAAGGIEIQNFTTAEGKKEEQPLRIDFSLSGKTRTMNRIGVHLLPDSELTVIMDFSSEKDSEGTMVVQLKVLAEENAVLHIVQIQRLGRNVTLLDDFGADCRKNARIETIQLILCDEEDVEGNHGATIGKIDEELLFYLESRGISEESVYAMMARARIDAICNKIPDEETRKKVQNYLEGEKEA